MMPELDECLLDDLLALPDRRDLPPCAYGVLWPGHLCSPSPTGRSPSPMAAPSVPRDEATVARLTEIADALVQAHVDPAAVMPLIEPVIAATTALREQLCAQGLRTPAVGPAVAQAIVQLLSE